MVCVAIRLQDLSPRIRSKCSLIFSRVSLDDFQLKIRNLLRNSKYRDEIIKLPKGQFIFPELDLKLTTEPFIQVGKPTEFKPNIPKPQTNQEFYDSLPLWKRIVCKIMMLKPIKTEQEQQESNNEDDTESELDVTMTDGDDDLFPTDLED